MGFYSNWMPPICLAGFFTFHIDHPGEKKIAGGRCPKFLSGKTTSVVGLMFDPFDHGMNIIGKSQFTGISPWFCAFEGGVG